MQQKFIIILDGSLHFMHISGYNFSLLDNEKKNLGQN